MDSKYVSEHNNRFFSDVSRLKLIIFSIFFHRLILPTNTCHRLRCIQNPVKHLQWRFFAIFFGKIHKKTSMLESLFNKVAGLYPATLLKERTPTQVFSDKFCEILRQNTSRRLLPFYGKYFTNKIVMKSLRKEKKNENNL